MNIKKIAAAAITAAVMLSAVTAGAAGFTDTRGHWAEDIINSLADRGVVNGVTPNTFNPDGTVTRAEFLKMAMEVNGIKTVPMRAEECLDAGSGDWFADYLQSALDKGLIPSEMISGYSAKVFSETDDEGNVSSRALYSGVFGGNALINREETAVIAQAAYQYSLNANTMKYMNEPEELAFTDNDDISVWAAPSVKLACAQSFIQGMDDGSFAPKSTLTRAQAAAIIGRIMDKVNNNK